MRELKKEIVKLYIVVLLPQIFGRQLLYFIALSMTGNPNFIDSFETLWMAKNGFLPWLGILEELFIGFVYINLILLDNRFWFLIYGWVFDAWQDSINAITWIMWRFDYVHVFTNSFFWREFIENVLFPYMIFGPLIYFISKKIKRKNVLKPHDKTSAKS